jgi:phage terminase Nu1 subunit (DNA packaging protein)
MPPDRFKADYSRVSAQDIALLTGVDPRTVTRWCGQGVPRNDDGTFDAPAVVQWRIARAEARGELDQRQRLARAQAERVERQNEIEARALIPAAQAVEVWSSILTDARNKMLAVPSKLAPRLAYQPVEVVAATLREEIHQVLTDLADGRSDDGLSDLNNR